MIKVYLGEVLDAINPLTDILTQEFDGALAFKISRLIKALNKELDIFNETRRNLINKYSLKDENGNNQIEENGNIRLNPDTINQCNKEFEDLARTEIEINVSPLTLDEISKFRITPENIGFLIPFVEDEQE